MSKSTLVMSVILASVLSFFAGGITGSYVGGKLTTNTPSDIYTTEYGQVAVLSKSLKPGESATIVVDENKVGPHVVKKGPIIKSEKAYTSLLSPIGLSAVEAGTKDQGFKKIDEGGNEVGQVGENKGQGILETAWAHARGWMVVGLIVLGVVFIILPILAALIPSLAPAIGTIVSTFGSVLASAVPFLGGIVMWIKKNILHTATGQIIQGGDNFKAKIKQTVFVEDIVKNNEIITKVLDIFAAEMNSSQDTTAKSLVNSFQRKS